MFSIRGENKTDYTYLGLFAGAGGLDLGFELAGFQHTESNEILEYAVETLRMSRPDWEVVHQDVRECTPSFKKGLDVLLAGFPCQGFSLGGNRDEADERNTLYREVVRIAKYMQPRVIVMENVLNLRTMVHPETGKPFAQQISKTTNKGNRNQRVSIRLGAGLVYLTLPEQVNPEQKATMAGSNYFHWVSILHQNLIKKIIIQN